MDSRNRDQFYYIPDNLSILKERKVNTTGLNETQRRRYAEIQQHVEKEFAVFIKRITRKYGSEISFDQGARKVKIPWELLKQAVIARYLNQGTAQGFPSYQTRLKNMFEALGWFSIILSIVYSVFSVITSNQLSEKKFYQVMFVLLGIISTPNNLLQISPRSQSHHIIYGQSHFENFSLNISDQEESFFINYLCAMRARREFSDISTPKRLLNNLHNLFLYAVSFIAWAFAGWAVVVPPVELAQVKSDEKTAILVGWILTPIVIAPGLVYYFFQSRDSMRKTISDFLTKHNPLINIIKISPLQAVYLIIDFALNILNRGFTLASLPGVILGVLGVTFPRNLSVLVGVGAAYNFFCTRNILIREALSPFTMKDPFGFTVTDSRILGPDVMEMSSSLALAAELNGKAKPIMVALVKGGSLGFAITLLLLGRSDQKLFSVSMGTLVFLLYGCVCFFSVMQNQLEKSKRQQLDNYLLMKDQFKMVASNGIHIFAALTSIADKILRSTTLLALMYSLLGDNINQMTLYAVTVAVAIPTMWNEYGFQTPRVVNSTVDLVKNCIFFQNQTREDTLQSPLLGENVLSTT